MRTLASFIFIILDGFYEGPNGELDWPNVDAEFNDFAVRQLDEADTRRLRPVATVMTTASAHSDDDAGEAPGERLELST